MPVVGEAHIVVRAITTGFADDVRRGIDNDALSRIGQQAGRSLSGGFGKGSSGKTSKFAKEIEAARLKLQQLVMQGYFVGPALGTAASALASLGASAFALGAQVSAALPALIVLPSIFSAMGQAMATAKLAFSGLGKAIGALGKQRKSSGIDRMPGLLSAYAAAQERVNSADKRVLKSKEALTKAYIDAQEALDQLNFDVEDAAIAEKRAAIDLEKARETLARVQDLPPNNAARREAELAFQEADLGYRRAIDRNKDLAEEAEKRNAAGVAGSQEVLSAEEDLTEAQKDQKKALIELAKATKALNDAKAGKGGGGSSAPDPLEGLSKEAAAFAKYIASLKGKTAELKAAAGRQLFGQLETAIQNLVDNLLPRLAPILEATGGAIGKAAVDFSKLLTSANNLKNLDTVAKTNTDTIGKLGKVVGNLFSAFLSLLAAADPVVDRFTDWVVVLTDGWKASTEAKNQTGQLTKTFEYAGDVAAQLGRIFGNLGRAIFDIGTSAAGPGSGGEMLLDMLEGASIKFQAFVDKAQQGGRLEEFFRTAATNAAAIGRLINAIVVEFMKLGDNKEVAEVADGLIPAVESLGRMLDILTGGGPALGEFVTKLITLLEKFAETGSIDVFFGILGKVLDVLNAIFGNSMVMKIFGVLAMLKAAMIATSLVTKVFGFYGKAILGTIAKLIGLGNTQRGLMIIQRLFRVQQAAGTTATTASTFALIRQKIATAASAAATKAWTAIQRGFNAVMAMNPVMLTVIAIGLLVAGIILAYKKVGWFRDLVDGAFGAIKNAVMGVVNWVTENWPKILAVLTGPIGIAVLLITQNWDKIKSAFSTVWNWLKDTVTGIPGFFGRMFDGIPDIVSKAWDGIKNGFKAALNWIIDKWNGLEFTVPKIGKGPFSFGGFTIGLPDIPRLADGGIISPSSGGTLAMIAEAGRSERVEPLDPDGLSKRDKAMIAKLSGGSGGGMTINVYPSPGMNEVELAALVNRQISFQLRKGAA